MPMLEGKVDAVIGVDTQHEPTKRYVARRTLQGKSRREIRRCPARSTARQLFRLLEHQPATTG